MTPGLENPKARQRLPSTRGRNMEKVLTNIEAVARVVEASDDSSGAVLPFQQWRKQQRDQVEGEATAVAVAVAAADGAAAANEGEEGGNEEEEDPASTIYRALRSARGSGDGQRDERYWARRLWAFMSKVRELKSAPKREKDLDDAAHPWACKWA